MKAITFILRTCLFAACLYAGMLHAQVSVTNSLPDPSAALDLTSGKKCGLLLPRVNLQNLTDSASINTKHPAKSLLLYSTGASLPDGKGFYYWSGTNWQMLEGDNLGNHVATQGLGMGGNTLSNDGSAAKGLSFDTAGNAFFKQQLIIKSFGVVASGDNLISVTPAGLVGDAMTEAGVVSPDNFAYKSVYTLSSVAPGDSSSITAANIRTATYMVVVTTGNICGRTGVGVFMVSNGIVSFMGGQARDAKYTVTALAGNRKKLDTGMVSCQDGGGGNQFGFTIVILPGNGIRIINSGSFISQAYNISVTEV